MDFLLQYALTFAGTPYKWGGNHPAEGLDCSGFVQILLAAAGIKPPGDQSAQSLYDAFEKTGSWNDYRPGALLFYGKSAKEVTHIAFLLSPQQLIEAGGGGSKTLTKQDAIDAGAFVRLRPVGHRTDLVAAIRPNYSKIGVM